MVLVLSLSSLKEIRERLLSRIKKQNYSFYWKKLKDLDEKLKAVLDKGSTNPELMDDTVWLKEFRKVWWRENFPFLNDTISKLTVPPVFTFAPAVVSKLFPGLLNKIVGEAEWYTPAVLVVFKLLLLTYFSNKERLIPVSLNMDMTFRERKRDNGARFMSGLQNQFSAALSGSGPFMLKVLQQMTNLTSEPPKNEKICATMRRDKKDTNASKGKSKRLLQKLAEKLFGQNTLNVEDLTKDVFNSVPPLTDAEKEIILAETDLKGFRFTKILGAASIAEAWEVEYTSDSGERETAVLKFLRPMYIFYFLCEIDFLLNTVWPQISEFVKKTEGNEAKRNSLIVQSRQFILFLIRTYIVEFDYKQEADFTSKGYLVYNRPKLNIFSSQLIRVVSDPFPYMLQTKATECTLKSMVKYLNSDSFKKKYTVPESPEESSEERRIKSEKLRRTIRSEIVSMMIFNSLANLMRLWFENVFWPKSTSWWWWGTPADGFFHADLHLGNIMTCSVPELVERYYRGQKYAPLYIIDYGNCGVMSPRERCDLLTCLLIGESFESLWDYCPGRYKGEVTEIKEPLNETAKTMMAEIEQLFRHTPSAESQKLRKILRHNWDKVVKTHVKNEKTFAKFMGSLWKLCNVQQPQQTPNEELFRSIVNYNVNQGFSELFLQVAKTAKDIGLCMSNSVISFGKGIAFVSDTFKQFTTLCDDPLLCKQYSVDGVVKSNLLKNPRQLYNYQRGNDIC